MTANRRPLGALRLNFYSDPAHGWLRVPIALLEELRLTERISPYSYWERPAPRGTGWAYLEEDRDATLFRNAMQSAGILFTIHEMPQAQFSSRIRRLRSFPITA